MLCGCWCFRILRGYEPLASFAPFQYKYHERELYFPGFIGLKTPAYSSVAWCRFISRAVRSIVNAADIRLEDPVTGDVHMVCLGLIAEFFSTWCQQINFLDLHDSGKNVIMCLCPILIILFPGLNIQEASQMSVLFPYIGAAYDAVWIFAHALKRLKEQNETITGKHRNSIGAVCIAIT